MVITEVFFIYVNSELRCDITVLNCAFSEFRS